MKSTRNILSFYSISAEKIEPIAGGLINKTWKVQTLERTYILQWVNPIFSHLIMEDLPVVIANLKDKGFLTIEIIKTKSGNLYVPDERGFWRVFTYIPGVVYKTVHSPKIAREAGKLLGRFHKALSGLEHEFHYDRPLHRQSAQIYEKYSNTLKERSDIFDVEFKKQINAIDDLPSLLLPATLPRRVTHGDPKITNVIFDKDDNAITLIDLDDCGNQHSVLIDIGDALRSWCQNEDATLSLERYQAATEGYLDGSQGLLSRQEKKLIPQALKLITLELASRFAIDMAEDYYFAWNKEKYKTRYEHNRARVLKIIHFYKDICENEKELRNSTRLS